MRVSGSSMAGWREGLASDLRLHPAVSVRDSWDMAEDVPEAALGETVVWLSECTWLLLGTAF